MSGQKLLGLPPVSPELKQIAPYLQRADELKQQEPIMAYWCAYYAAQLGISLKAKDTPSRTLLFELLGTLEKMKTAIGPSDAIDLEIASAAYVENFALRVFGAADDEDRKGKATRATAKKFLAATNFLEVLKVFPKSDVSEANDEKIRYAKWKAADISKAIREGRKPTIVPGNDELFTPPAVETTAADTLNHSPTHYSPPTAHTKPAPLDSSLLAPKFGGQGEITPGGWSSVATPGNPSPRTAGGTFYQEPESPSAPKTTKTGKTRSGSGSSSGSTASLGGRGRRSSLSQKSPREDSGSPGSKKSVHFTPSVAGGSSTTGSPPPSSPSTIDHHFAPHDIYAPPQRHLSEFYDNISHGDFVPPPPVIHSHDSQPSVPPLPPSQRGNIYAGVAPSGYSPNNIYAPPSAPFSTPPVPQPTTSEPVELTPAIIAKAQKHCRFAISSLDYEDAEQARKELRAALKVLGG